MAGMFLLFRSEAYKGVGGFDERFHLYCEDFDICARIRLLGWPIGLSDAARVIHDARRASHDSPEHLFWHVCSLLRMWTTRSWWKYRAMLHREAEDRAKRRISIARSSEQQIRLERSIAPQPVKSELEPQKEQVEG